MSADFSKVAAHLAQGLQAHADAEYGKDAIGLRKVRKAVFLARGGHAPGDRCALVGTEDGTQ